MSQHHQRLKTSKHWKKTLITLFHEPFHSMLCIAPNIPYSTSPMIKKKRLWRHPRAQGVLAGSAKWIRCWDWHWSRPSAAALAKMSGTTEIFPKSTGKTWQNRHNLNSSGLWNYHNYHNYHQVLKLDMFLHLHALANSSSKRRLLILKNFARRKIGKPNNPLGDSIVQIVAAKIPASWSSV